MSFIGDCSQTWGRFCREGQSLMMLFQWSSVCSAKVRRLALLSTFLTSASISFSILLFGLQNNFHLSINCKLLLTFQRVTFSTWSSYDMCKWVKFFHSALEATDNISQEKVTNPELTGIYFMYLYSLCHTHTHN